jgi:hypothetical protein
VQKADIALQPSRASTLLLFLWPAFSTCSKGNAVKIRTTGALLLWVGLYARHLGTTPSTFVIIGDAFAGACSHAILRPVREIPHPSGPFFPNHRVQARSYSCIANLSGIKPDPQAERMSLLVCIH